MTTHYFGIYDRKAKVFGDLISFGSREKEAVVRFFRDVVLNGNSDNYLAKYASDFDLYYIGFFDKAQGEFISEVTDPETGETHDLREFIINASAYFSDHEEDNKED